MSLRQLDPGRISVGADEPAVLPDLGHAVALRHQETSPPPARHDPATTAPSPGPDRLQWAYPFLWVSLAGVALACSIVPVDSPAQGIMALVSILLLYILRGRATEERTDIPRALVLLLGSFISLRYLGWRAMYTLNSYDTISTIFSLLLFLAEVYAMLIHLGGVFVNFYPLKRVTPPFKPGAEVPTVDILVPSYNEAPEILEVTLRACRMVRYPEGRKVIWLCDDGGTDQKCNDPDPAKATEARERRATLQQLCARLGVRYLTRPRNEHAKAGNVNHALTQTGGDLVLILDADHVPTADFLEQTAPWFQWHEKVFLVQTPHFMINPDPVDRNLLNAFTRMPAENDMFYLTIQRGLDYWGGSFFCGSAAVLRRKHLDLVGGLAGQTITEDAETALALHGRGLESVYIDRPMVAGLAPESFSGFVIQRMRWTQGMTQILLLNNPLRQKGLSWTQKICYISSAAFWLFPLARLAYLLAPTAYLFAGLQIYNATSLQILVYALPHMVASLTVTSMLFQRTRWPFISELYEVMQSLYSIRALLQVFRSPRKPSFVVTPKGETLESDFVSPLARPFYFLLGIVLLAFLAGAARLYLEPLSRDLTIVVLFWNGFNFILLLAAFGALLERRQRRNAPRMPIQMQGVLRAGGQELPCRVDDLSIGGARLVFDGPAADLKRGMTAELLVTIPALGRETALNIELRSSFLVAGRQAVGTMFAPRSEQERDDAVALMYADSNAWSKFIAQRTRPIPFLRAVKVLLLLTVSPVKQHVLALVHILAGRLNAIPWHSIAWRATPNAPVEAKKSP